MIKLASSYNCNIDDQWEDTQSSTRHVNVYDYRITPRLSRMFHTCSLCGRECKYLALSQYDNLNLCNRCIVPFKSRQTFDCQLYYWLIDQLIEDTAKYIILLVVQRKIAN